MPRRVRLTFRLHEQREQSLSTRTDVDALVALAMDYLTDDYLVARIALVNDRTGHSTSLDANTPWTLADVPPSRSAVHIDITEYPRRTPEELVTWLFAEQRPALAELLPLGLPRDSRAAGRLLGNAVTDEVLTSWIAWSRQQRADFLYTMRESLGMAHPEQVQFVEPDLFIATARLRRLAELSGLSAADIVTVLENGADVGTYSADLHAIASGSVDMRAMTTDDGRALLHRYADVAYIAGSEPADGRTIRAAAK
jgi:hypothetical protein